MSSLRLSIDIANKCNLPFLDPNGNVVYFDIQSAEPGTFTVPGVIELENYEPGSMVESSWIYFKGNPQAGPQPGHPFERPFNNSAQFSIDIVGDNDTSKVLREIMRPSLFPSTYRRANIFTGDHSTHQFFCILERRRAIR